MRLFKRATTGSGQAAKPTDIDVIRAKLADCEAEIRTAEAALRQAALGAVLSDDPRAGYEPIAELQALRARRELMQVALQAAEQAERDRVAALHARERKAKARALAQHAGRLQRDAADVSTALRQLHDALNRMTASGAAITALLPASMKTIDTPFDRLLGDVELRQMTLLEGHRQSRESQLLLFDRPPAARALERSEDGGLPALSDRIASLTASVRARFDQSAPVAPADQPTPEHAAKPQTPLPVCSVPASSLPAIVDVPPSAPAIAGSSASPTPPLAGVQIDLRSNAGDRFRDLTERVTWPSGEPVTEAGEPTPPAEPAELIFFKE